MPTIPGERSFREHYARGFGVSARNNALAYGYSVTITLTFGMLQHFHRPSVADMFLFGAGAGAAFAIINGVATRGFRRRIRREPRLVLSLATAFNFLSIGAALGVATLGGWLLDAWVAWLVTPFASTFVYVVFAALETALAHSTHVLAGTELEEPEEE